MKHNKDASVFLRHCVVYLCHVATKWWCTGAVR